MLYEGTIVHDKAMEVCGRLSKQFGDDVAFEFTCWKFARLAGMQELNLKVKERFDAEGISFAFPSQTLYVKQDSEWRPKPDSAVPPAT